MEKGAGERLRQVLASHIRTAHETFEALDDAASTSSEKVSLEDVIKLGEHLSKQATLVGMLWSGESPSSKSVEDAMGSFFNALQGLLLVAHVSRAGAGPTLRSIIHSSAKHILVSSTKLMTETTSFYASGKKQPRDAVPKLVGEVWEACGGLKKIPTTNVAAIGRELAKVATSVKDVHREMGELSSNQTGDGSSSDDDEVDDSLSAEESKVAEAVRGVVAEAVVYVKELIRAITAVGKGGGHCEEGEAVGFMEKVLKQCQGLSVQIDELGASVYPPQETHLMAVVVHKLCHIDLQIAQLVAAMLHSDSFVASSRHFRDSLNALEKDLPCAPPDFLQC